MEPERALNEPSTGGKIFNLSKKYLMFLFFYMMLYEFMDSYTTSYYTAVVSYIQADFQIDNSQFYLIQAVASVGLLLVIFIQNLADRIGRKPMMIIVFFGMGFSAFIMHISHNVFLFTIGFLLSWIFFSSDIWVIIISEEAPADKRARYSYLVAVVGALGAIAIPICRSIFVRESPAVNPSAWRGMNYLAISAMGLALLGFFLKETNAFIEKRKMASAEIKTNKNRSSSTRKALFTPFAFESRSKIIAFMFIGFLLGITAAVISTFEDFLTTLIVTENGGEVSDVTTVIYVVTLGTFVFFGITGILADKLGRKPTLYIYAGINIFFFLLLVLTADLFATAGIFWVFSVFGFFVNGSFWGMFMLSKTFCVESFSTEIRGTSAGWRSLSYALGLILGSLISSGLAVFLELKFMFLLASIVTGLGITILTAKFLPETKGIDII